MEKKQEFINWFLQAEKFLNPLLAMINYEMILGESEIKIIDYAKTKKPKQVMLNINWTIREAQTILYSLINETIREYYDCCD